MESKEQIIRLGKLLAEEQRRGFDDTAADGGLERFLTTWRLEADGALQYAAVRQTLESLAGYAMLDLPTRRARIGISLESLRALFRERPAPATPEVAAVQAAPAVQLPTRKSASKSANRPAAPLTLDTPIEALPGVGRQNATAFKRLGVRTVHDMLYHFPHRYDDFTSQRSIADLQIGATETVIGEISDLRTFGMRSGGSGIEILISDDSSSIKLVFFRQPWLSKQLKPGMKLVVSGKVDAHLGIRQMTAPDWQLHTDDELVHVGRLVPVHPLTKGLIERSARTLIKQVVDRATPLVIDHLPAAVCERAGLMPLAEALAQIHFPADKATLERARRRLAFDEFLFIQLGVLQRKVLWQAERGEPIEFKSHVHEEFLTRLPFDMTGAQVRAIEELMHDMARPVPMARLLQGDVGSGKTAVAAATAIQAIANGFQAALMAPTEILAEQHYRGLRALLGKVHVRHDPPVAGNAAEAAHHERIAEIKRLLGMAFDDELDGQGARVALLTGSLGAKARRKVLEGLAEGDIDLVVGTHALITETVQYARLGLVIVDEQHRFGVEQRQRLKEKGFNPHMLVMTATPIPRTLTLTIYGDLDTSVLDELPPGRQEIRTRWIASVERDKAYKHMRREIGRGRQAFVICPLVEESEKVDLPSAEEMYDKLSSSIFPDLRVALIHGKMLPRDKDAIMVAFRNHEYDILVATAVIEVGIDVPNATTILIEGADRFGLAQLHQFRGRVGRGIHQSYCILVSDRDNEVTKQRLEAMEQTRDGFKLAEIDLQLRGPGEFFGTRQSGTPDLKIAQLADTRLLHAANREAQLILADDPQLAKPEHARLKAHVENFWSESTKAG
ncbi:MAG TPA: ATP-dependent DNA helicase RecG [Roseiflexaceae bacterium]|nr:ATP-dependent DNA helicase RecG [Roseiflexaceae bacterium]